MKNYGKLMKNYEKLMKNDEKLMKNFEKYENQWKTVKNYEKLVQWVGIVAYTNGRNQVKCRFDVRAQRRGTSASSGLFFAN